MPVNLTTKASSNGPSYSKGNYHQGSSQNNKYQIQAYADKYEKKSGSGNLAGDQRQKINVIVDEDREPLILKKSEVNLIGKNVD